MTIVEHPTAIADPHGEYQMLVSDRRERGMALHGDRHLARLDLLREHLAAVADTLVLLRLEQDGSKRRPSRHSAYGRQLAEVMRAVVSFGERSERACRSMSGGCPEFARLFDVRYGNALTSSDDQPRQLVDEALDKLADAQIMALLELDRRARTRRADPPLRHFPDSSAHALLAGLVHDAEQLGVAMCALRDAVAPQLT